MVPPVLQYGVKLSSGYRSWQAHELLPRTVKASLPVFPLPNPQLGLFFSKKEFKASVGKNVGTKCGDIGRGEPTSGFLAAGQECSGRWNFYPRSFSPKERSLGTQSHTSSPPASSCQLTLENFLSITSDCQQSMQKIGVFANKSEMF